MSLYKFSLKACSDYSNFAATSNKCSALQLMEFILFLLVAAESLLSE